MQEAQERPLVETPDVLIAQLDTLFADGTESKDVDINLPDGIIVNIKRERYKKSRALMPGNEDLDLLIAVLIDKDVNRQRTELLTQFLKRAAEASVAVIDEEAEFGTLTDGTKIKMDEATFIPVSHYPIELLPLPNEFGLVMQEDKHIRLTTVEKPPVKAAEDHGSEKESNSAEEDSTQTEANDSEAEQERA